MLSEPARLPEEELVLNGASVAMDSIADAFLFCAIPGLAAVCLAACGWVLVVDLCDSALAFGDAQRHLRPGFVLAGAVVDCAGATL